MPSYPDFQDHVALVTGAGSGIGRTTALHFARAGARVVVAEKDAATGRETAQTIEATGGESLFVEVDVSDEAQVEAMVSQTIERFGGLHAVSNNAARGVGFRPLTEIRRERWDTAIGVGLTGVWLCLKHEIPAMLASGGGAIVNIASLSGVNGEANQAAYAAAKGGVLALTKTAAAECAQQGIRINAIAPGGIETPGMAALFDHDPELRAPIEAKHAMGRLGRPEEIADAVLYLCSPQASFLTGHVMVADGGLQVN